MVVEVNYLAGKFDLLFWEHIKNVDERTNDSEGVSLAGRYSHTRIQWGQLPYIILSVWKNVPILKVENFIPKRSLFPNRWVPKSSY